MEHMPEPSMGDLAMLPEEFLEFVIQRLEYRDVIRLSAASSSMREFCLQEPLWKTMCLRDACGQLQYKGSWKATALGNISTRLPRPGNASWLPRCCTPAQYNIFYRCHMDIRGLVPGPQAPTVEVIDSDSFSKQNMSTAGPKVLRGLMKDWRAMGWLSPGALHPHFDTLFQVAKPGGGSTLMTLRDYLSYAAVQRDEEPLYIFDENFGQSAPSMLGDYSVPEPFREDMFEPLGKRRPDFRWLIIGPMRSGSSWHWDPNSTFAFNSLIAGHKRWAFYPPEKVPPGVSVSSGTSGEEDFHSCTPLRWFLEVYPTLAPGERPLEAVQKPGETMFVGARWWHCVLNLDDTVAVTQNFVPRATLEATVRELAWGTSASTWLVEKAMGIRMDAESGSNLKPPNAASLGSGFQQRPPWSPLGYERCRILGPWLQSLSEKHPELRPCVLELAERYAFSSIWRQRLAACCPGAEKRQDAPFPVSGGATVLFSVDSVFCKIYTHEAAERNVASWRAETAALKAIAASESLQQHAPRLVAAGTLPPDELSHIGVPFLVMSACPGSALASNNCQVDAGMAALLGTLVAEIHGLPIPSAAGGSGYLNGAYTDGKQEHATDGSTFASTAQPYTFFNDEKGHSWHWMKGTRGADAQPGRDPSSNVSGSDPAGPFKAFLQSRRRTVIGELAADEVLPRRLHAELEAYLPADPAALIPDGFQPAWVHGDLTHGNILSVTPVAEGGAAQLNIIDFGDAGLGDPLWDLVSVHLAIFRCQPELLRSFLAAYRLHVGGKERQGWLQEGKETLSYRAMCYTLLHEQDLLKAAIKRNPCLCIVGSLDELQRLLWGVLHQ